MFRQGCVRAKFNTDYTFTYPGTAASLGTVTLETIPATSGVESQFRASDRFTHTDWRQFNPCTINGIRCNVAYSSVTPLEPCADIAGGWISAYGASISPSVDVNIYYIGRNGGYSSTDMLVAQNKAMADFGSSQYIVLGFHEPVSKLASSRPVDDTYVGKMEEAFGDHFLNLNKEIRSRAAEITWKSGVYSSIEGYGSNSADQEYVNNGNIPHSLYKDDLYHPNAYGCKAFAMLIHDKMVKLGYLEDDYILSTGSEL